MQRWADLLPVETEKRDPAIRNTELKWPQHALVFDCETRITTDQALTFGFWRFGELRNGIYECKGEGIVHDDSELAERELNILSEYARTTKPDTDDDGSDRLRLCCRSKFISEVLGWAIQGKALIVGFNLPFDLSRLALDWETAKNGGWSLILSQWRNPENGQLKASKYFPRVVIKALNSKTAIIHSTRAPVSEPGIRSKRVILWPAARFLDLRTPLWALRNRSYSLKTACKEFNIPSKLEHKPSGRVSREEIEYCRQDVRATVGLLNAVKKEYDLHPFSLGPDKMFSPASVAKAYLEKLNIFYLSGKIPDTEINSAYGIAMQFRGARRVPNPQLRSARLPRGFHVSISHGKRTPR